MTRTTDSRAPHTDWCPTCQMHTTISLDVCVVCGTEVLPDRALPSVWLDRQQAAIERILREAS